MARKYTHLKDKEEEMIEAHRAGLSMKETAEKYGVTKKQFENLQNRYHRKQKNLEKGIIPGTKGRPRTRPITGAEEKDKYIQKLEMENELLRDFLRLCGRR